MKKEVVEKLATLMTAALGFVAALAWNEAIQSIFKKIFGETSDIYAMILYAIIITIIAVMLTIWIGKVSDRIK